MVVIYNYKFMAWLLQLLGGYQCLKNLEKGKNLSMESWLKLSEEVLLRYDRISPTDPWYNLGLNEHTF